MVTRAGVQFFLFLLLAVSGSATATLKLPESLQHELDLFLAENPMAPGVSVHLICPELDLDWSGVAGVVEKGSPEPLTARHTFRIASNTKTYVASAVLRLVEMGQLELDQSLIHYLDPGLAKMLSDDGYDLQAITLAHTLSHTAGFADHTNDPRYEQIILTENQHQWTSGEQLQALVDWMDPLGTPGQRYVYSDSGYIILGTIVEKLTGNKLGPAVRQLVGFAGLGLQTTFWEYMEEPRPHSGPRAHQYFDEYDVTDWNASFDLYGGGGIVTDAEELTRFMRLLLQGQVLKNEATLARMTGRGTETYRLGLIVQDFQGQLAWGHAGFWNTFAYHFPGMDLTLGGSVMNHHATHYKELVVRLVGVVAKAKER